MSILGTLAIGTGIANAVGSIGGSILNQYNADKTREFNREEAEKNRTFQKEMAQNNIKYAVNQANELGISPSLVLGDQTTSLGGSQASVGNPAPNNNLLGVDQLANVLQKQYQMEMNEDKLEAIKEMHEDKMQTQKEIQRMKMSNSSFEYIQDNTSTKYLALSLPFS